jgi:hypothetical protein
VTHAESQKGKLALPVWAAILLLAWVVAASFNAGEVIMGGPPPASGVVTTLVAIFAWPAAGWFAGSRSGAGFARLATVFWVTVVVGAPLVFWALIEGPGLTVSQGGGVLLLLGFVLTAPLYGVAALLPTWDSFAYETLLWTVVIGVSVWGMTLVAHLVRRRRSEIA